MRSRPLLALLDAAVFILAIAGFAYVPASAIPKAAWAIILGSYSLLIYLARLTRRRFLDADVARLLASAVFLSSGTAIWLGVSSPLALFGIMVASILLTGLVWSAFYATATGPGQSGGG